MLVLIILFPLIVVFVEGTTELLSKSVILLPLRKILSSGFFGEMLSCGYCTSVWVAILPAVFYAYSVGSLLSFILFLVVFHRASNYLHNFNDKFLDKFYRLKNKE